MSSQALYRRYRSQTFDELIGQEHIVRTLRNAIAEGRIAHAYLFTGPRGVGKTTVARLLAKAVNCDADFDQRPCGSCKSCRAIAEGSAVDVIEMDAASHTSVDDAREIIERVQFRPASSVYKVYIIDEVHMLSTAAFNALLKTLEEPPGHALFILATTEVHKVPATILSRCQRFTFNRHSANATAAHLQQVASAEGVELEAGAADMIARASTGSLRDALSILDQLMSYGAGTITMEQVRSLLGASETQSITALIEAFTNSDLTRALQTIAGVAAQGADLRQFTRDLVERLRALLLIKAGADSGLLDLSEDEQTLFHQQAAAIDLGAMLSWVKLFSGLDHQLRTSPYGQLPLELAVVEAIIGPQQVTPPVGSSLSQRPRTAQAGQPRSIAETPRPHDPPKSAPLVPDRSQIQASNAIREASNVAPPAAPEPEKVPVAIDEPSKDVSSTEEIPALASIEEANEGIASVNAAVAELERVESIWPEVVRDVRVYDKTLQALLNSGVRPVDVKEMTVVLEVANEFLLNKLEKPNLRQVVERVLAKHMGGDYQVRCTLENQRREDPNKLREHIRASRKDPLVKAAINIFDADIVGIEQEE